LQIPSVPIPVARAPVVQAQIDTTPPLALKPPSHSTASQVKARAIPPVKNQSEEPYVEPKNKSEHSNELKKYNLEGGEEVVLRKEYTPAAARIRIGAVYRDIPHNEEEKIGLKIDDVSLGGGDDQAGRNTSLTIVDVHRDRYKFDDWYLVKVSCSGCPPGTVTPEGWVAAKDIISWRDDPLCVRGTKDCD
jgi:hypothetical protein